MEERGLSQSGTKDDLLERFGIPARQWKKWCKRKLADLKPFVKHRGLKVSGTKDELLVRLGVPTGFGETLSDRVNCEYRECKKRKREQMRRMESMLKKLKRPEDDPNIKHVSY